jgi:hypothetical protein
MNIGNEITYEKSDGRNCPFDCKFISNE